MRDYTNIDRYLTELSQDIYRQPSGHDEHYNLAYKVIDLWMSRLTSCKSVLDAGCGDGFAADFFEKTWGIEYEGIALGEDYLFAKETNRNVKKMDFSFLEYEDSSFDLVFSRHSLEHSPMVILTLMEWHRVAKNWLGLVLPHPDFYTYTGKNHYAVMNHEQIAWLLERTGWKIIWDEVDYMVKNITTDNPQGVMTPHEMWLFCEKVKR
jgi:SAM-dependent methyltransferase